MSGTAKTVAALYAELPDNTSQLVVPADIRDVVASAQRWTNTTVRVTDPEYGATGNGSTDDTTAFTNAIASGASTVFVPDGTYILNGITLNNADQTLWLSHGAVLKAKAAFNSTLVTISAARVHFIGEGRIEGNSANVTSSGGVSVNAVADVRIDGITVNDTKGYGIYGSDCDRLLVSNCTVTATTTSGIYVETLTTSKVLADVEIRRCRVDRSTISAASIVEGGIKVHATATTSSLLRTKVIDNSVKLPVSPTAGASIVCIEVFKQNDLSVVVGNTTESGFTGLSFDTSTLAACTGNAVYNASGFGIELAGCTRSTVTGNSVDGNSLTTDGIFANDNSGSGINDGCVISSNAVHGCSGKAIHIFKANSCSLTGNVARLAVGGNSVIALENSVDVAITGGEVDGVSAAGQGVTVNDSQSVTVTGVFFHDLTTCAVSIFSDTASTWDNILVADCTVKSAGPVIATTLTLGAIGNNVAAMNCIGVVGSSTTNGNARRGSCLDWKNQVWDFIGSGSPASSVTAGPGSIYRNQAGGTTTTLYVKESGTGNTGWVAK